MKRSRVPCVGMVLRPDASGSPLSCRAGTERYVSVDVGLIAVMTLVLSALLTGTVRRIALAKGVMDVPNERSSHVIPTPRGGGVAIVLTVTAALLVLLAFGKVPVSLV